jgi:hypothetical protein
MTTEAAMTNPIDMTFEIVVIPVSNVDRAKDFYVGPDGGSTPTSRTAPTTG